MLIALFFPLFIKAQWNAVRYDMQNVFEKVQTVNSNTVFVTGTNPNNQQKFMLKTNDAGTTWDSTAFLDLPGSPTEIQSMFFINENEGFMCGRDVNNNGILIKTIDNGATWINITGNSSFPYIKDIYFIDSKVGYLIESSSFPSSVLYKTTDGGLNWTQQQLSFYANDLFFSNENTGFICAEGAVIMKTNDGGKNWAQVLFDSNPNLFVSTFNKLDFVNPTIGFTAMANTGKLYKTLNGGNSWDTITFDSSYVTDFDFTTELEGHVLLNSGDIYSTIDGGVNWTLEYTTRTEQRIFLRHYLL